MTQLLNYIVASDFNDAWFKTLWQIWTKKLAYKIDQGSFNGTKRVCFDYMECKVVQEIELGDWVLLLGEIVETHVDEDKTDESKTAKIDLDKIAPLVYCAKAREYRSMGNLLGHGFKAGKTLDRQDIT